MSREIEAYIPPEMIQRVLESAGGDVVLIGGQALAFWMDHYAVRQPGKLPAISRDVDFFTPNAANSAPLEHFARAIGGRAYVQAMEAVTALIGSAIAPAEHDRVYNVDLLHAVVGLTRAEVEENAVLVELAAMNAKVRIMHPLHVLQSRNANLHLLTEKRDEIGKLQFRLAVEVARKFLEEQIALVSAKGSPDKVRERDIFDLIRAVSDYSAQDAAKKNAARYAIFLADALPAWLITSPAFWESSGHTCASACPLSIPGSAKNARRALPSPAAR